MARHAHQHTHRRPHPRRPGLTIVVSHTHRHAHTSPLDIGRTGNIDHRPHSHTREMESDLRTAARNPQP